MPLLDCKLGDKLRSKGVYRDSDWAVRGINTINGDLYLEAELDVGANHKYYRSMTVTSRTEHTWERVERTENA